MADTTRSNLLATFLAPAIEWAAGRGNKSALAEAMTSHTDKPVTRQMVGRWLDPDAKKRLEPNLGHGLLLAHCLAQLQQAETENPRPTT